MKVVNVKTATHPYIAATRLLTLLPPDLQPSWLKMPAKCNPKITAAVRTILWQQIRSRDDKTMRMLAEVRPDWVVGCCVDLDGPQVFDFEAVCLGQVLFRAARYAASLDLPPAAP